MAASLDPAAIAHKIVRYWRSASLPNTAMHPVRQPGKTLLAGSATRAGLLRGFPPTEGAVPRGGGALAGVLKGGTNCSTFWLLASMTPSPGPAGFERDAV